jgi:DNA-binding NtrC family response regulator
MSHKSIVLLEDDPNLRQSIALILQRAGYFVSPTDCVYAAMDLLKSKTYKLIIADNNIPETRMVLIPKVLGLYPCLSIVLLTDQSAAELEKEDRLLSAHYLIKPIAPERLLDSVMTIIGTNNHLMHM